MSNALFLLIVWGRFVGKAMPQYVVTFDICALAILFIILAMTLFRRWVPTYQNMVFLVLSVDITICTLASRLETLLQMNYSPAFWYPYAELFAGSVYFISKILIGVIFVFYVRSAMNKPLNIQNDFWRLLCPAGFAIALVLINLPTGLMFYYDASGFYHRGLFMPLFYLAGFYYAAVALIDFRRDAKILPERVYIVSRIYVYAFVLALLIQTLFPYVLIENFVVTVSLLMCYMTIQSPSEMLDSELDLLNHRAFLSNAQMNLVREKPFTVIYVGLDHMIDLQQIMGTEQLQKYLRMIRDYLYTFRDKAYVYRYSENVFALVLAEGDEQTARAYMLKLDQRMRQPWIFGNNNIHAEYYIWTASYPGQFATIEEMTTMCEVMEQPGNHQRQGISETDSLDFSKHISDKAFLALVIRGIHEKTAQVRYVPTYRLSDHKVISLDAVCFFLTPTGKWVNGMSFLHAGVKNQGSEEVANFVLAQSGHLLEDEPWISDKVQTIGVKVSGEEFVSSDFARRLRRIVNRPGVKKENICIKIFESEFIRLDEAGMERLDQMRQEGFSFVVDGVGTGLTDFYQLINAHAISVHLNPALITAASESMRAEKLVSNLIKMIHDSNQKVCADGIDTAWKANVAERLGCDYGQGSYFSEALQKGQLAGFFADMERKEAMRKERTYDI